MLITIILLTIFVFVFGVYIWTLKSRYKYFSCRNISGPPLQFFYGHSLKLWNAPLSFRQIATWTRVYGSIYGIFEGTKPVYIVSNADFLEEVYIKQFSSFHSRPINFLVRIFESKGSDLFFAHGDQWRRQRHVMNPSFTTLKLKTMAPLVNQRIQSFMTKINEINGQEFDIFMLYRRLTMDVLCK